MANQELVEALKELGREAVEAALENYGVACYDDEEFIDILECAAEMIEGGDFDLEYVEIIKDSM